MSKGDGRGKRNVPTGRFTFGSLRGIVWENDEILKNQEEIYKMKLGIVIN